MGDGVRLTEAQEEAADLCQEICERADVLGLGLVMFPVQEVRELVAAIRRRQLTAGRAALSPEGDGHG